MEKVCGVICEYNPLHRGHAHHLERARALTGADFVVCAMSGPFVQRGEPAVLDKWTRAQAALLAGADLVLELPALFAVRAAPDFAFGGAALLAGLGVVTHLSFGAEDADLAHLTDLAARGERGGVRAHPGLPGGRALASAGAGTGARPPAAAERDPGRGVPARAAPPGQRHGARARAPRNRPQRRASARALLGHGRAQSARGRGRGRRAPGAPPRGRGPAAARPAAAPARPLVLLLHPSLPPAHDAARGAARALCHRGGGWRTASAGRRSPRRTQTRSLRRCSAGATRRRGCAGCSCRSCSAWTPRPCARIRRRSTRACSASASAPSRCCAPSPGRGASRS